MRVFMVVLIAFCLMGVAFAADDHSNATEKKASDEITVSQAVKVGGKVLQAGRYRISCDRETITFEPVSGKGEKLTFPCRGKELATKASSTEMHLSVEGSDRVVSKLLLRGSNIEHAF